MSIHDVIPDTLARAQEVLDLLTRNGVDSATLLVVPQAGWSEADLAVLRRFQDSGHDLAAHGWTHQCPHIRTWKHRIHSVVLSRNLAEHLSLSADEIPDLLARSHQWFGDVGLKEPTLYVPPAWAMGPVPRYILRTLPFDRVELLTGVYHCRSDRFLRLPLVGYEADTRWRQVALRAVNAVNHTVAGVSCRPLRIAIHPFDLDFHLAEDLRRLVSRPLRFVGYADLAY